MAPERAMLQQFLEVVYTQAPRVHVSFASDPSAAFTAKIVQWFRDSVHRAILVQVGLQPTIAAGCVVRTTNKSFDFSLRHHFDEQRELLLEALEVPETAA
jgi:F0F1-type ATP synthase delta subunit